ncbi:hypothetical protein ACHAXN_001219 [Cyclotella atomus]|jgi:hypothetical protein
MFRLFSSSKIVNDSTSSTIIMSSTSQCSDAQSASSSPSVEGSKQHQKEHLSNQRRRLKSALYFACWPSTVLATLLILSSCSTIQAFATNNNKSALNQRRHEWIGKSVQYYSTVMRKNIGKEDGLQQTAAVEPTISLEYYDDEMLDQDFVELATKHYHARFLIKSGKWSSAEKLYRRIIFQLGSEEQCDNTKLAVSTLLLALHMQRTGDVKATRAVFLNFFRRVALVENDEEPHKCTCSAKVLQAFALFEMKNGHSAKSLEIIQRAVQMDGSLSPVLAWKQFRDAAAGRPYRPTFSFRKTENGLEP